MIFPFAIRTSLGARLLEFMGGSQSDYNGPLIHIDWISDMPRIQSAWNMVACALPSHDIRHFSKLPGQWPVVENPMLKIWTSRFQDNSYYSRLPETYSEFQAKLRPKLRSDDRRQRRRLSEIGIPKFEILVDRAEEGCDRWDAAIDAMIEQKSQRLRSSGVPDLFSDVTIQQFYRELPGRLIGQCRAHFSIFGLDDQILATHWGAVHRNRFYFLVPTYSSGEWGTYSPGRLLLNDLIKWSIENRIRVFDFTIGGEDYKKDWCDGEMPLFEHLDAITLLGLPYIGYIRLRRRARRSKRVWGWFTSAYSLVRYGSGIGSKR